ncbi:MAG: hypothetical protein QW429_04045 [Thermoprotei archaeon]
MGMAQREIREKRVQVLKTIALEDLERGTSEEGIFNHLFMTARLNWTLSVYAARDIAQLALQLAQAEMKKKIEGERHE